MYWFRAVTAATAIVGCTGLHEPKLEPSKHNSSIVTYPDPQLSAGGGALESTLVDVPDSYSSLILQSMNSLDVLAYMPKGSLHQGIQSIRTTAGGLTRRKDLTEVLPVDVFDGAKQIQLLWSESADSDFQDWLAVWCSAAAGSHVLLRHGRDPQTHELQLHCGSSAVRRFDMIRAGEDIFLGGPCALAEATPEQTAETCIYRWPLSSPGDGVLNVSTAADPYRVPIVSIRNETNRLAGKPVTAVRLGGFVDSSSIAKSDVMFNVASVVDGSHAFLTRVSASENEFVQRPLFDVAVSDDCFVRGPAIPLQAENGLDTAMVYIESCRSGTSLTVHVVDDDGRLVRSRAWPIFPEAISFSELWASRTNGKIVVGYQSDGMLDADAPAYRGGGKSGIYFVIDEASMKMETMFRQAGAAGGLVLDNGRLWMVWGRGRTLRLQPVGESSSDWILDLEEIAAASEVGP